MIVKCPNCKKEEKIMDAPKGCTSIFNACTNCRENYEVRLD